MHRHGMSFHIQRSQQTAYCISCHSMETHGQSLYVLNANYIPAQHFQNQLVPSDKACYTCHTDYTMYGPFKDKLRFGLEPHRQRHFKLSNDPFFVEKVRDIVGLYLHPPENAVVLCVDEKSQLQALERTQPMLPMGFGYVEGVTHDYRRHGTTTLFAALDTAKGKVLTQCRPRHRHQEYLGFLREIEKNVPETLDVHIIVDNYATHKHPRVKRWLAARPRFHVHFTPTYASWLNQVEIWFNRITQQAIRRGTFRSVKELIEKIDQYAGTSNNHAHPFVWTATADSIFAKIQRLCERISGTVH